MSVFILWHIHHFEVPEGASHRDAAGDVTFEEGDQKLIGVYSTRAHADEAIGRMREPEGFRDEPDCFAVFEYAVDEDNWTDGFVTV